jgi:uncharacterized membrane protein YfcA
MAAELALIVAIAFVAGTVQTSVGFGAALIFVPAATLVVGPQPAVAMMLIGVPAVAAVLYTYDRPRTPLRETAPAAVLSILGVPIGIWLLTQSNEDVLRLLVGFAVIATVVVNQIAWRMGGVVDHEPDVPRMGLAGAASGLMRGATSMGGPAMVLYFHWVGGSAWQFRSRMFSFAAMAGVPSIAIAVLAGVYDGDTIPVVVAGLAGAGLGILAGLRLRPWITDARLRRLSMALLATTALLAIATATQALL